MTEQLDQDTERINIAISKNSLKRLDELKEKAGFVSRGKTVEEAIEAAHSLRFEILPLAMMSVSKILRNPALREFITPLVLRVSRFASAAEFAEFQRSMSNLKERDKKD